MCFHLALEKPGKDMQKKEYGGLLSFSDLVDACLQRDLVAPKKLKQLLVLLIAHLLGETRPEQRVLLCC